ncbi:MAG: hypothetical protein R6V33_03190 [Pelovirga sp.]
MPTPYQHPAGLQPWKKDLIGRSICEGYEFSLLDDCDNAYRFTAVVSASRIADIFLRFSRFLSEESFFILEFYPDQLATLRSSQEESRPEPSVFYSPYLPTNLILQTITPYLNRMIHDGFVGFGLANNRKGLEFFCSEEKVLSFFTDNHLRLCNFFTRNQIPYSNELILPTDYDHHHLSLPGLSPEQLPDDLNKYGPAELDSSLYGEHLTDLLDMYEVEEGLSFFLTRKEQEQITELITSKLKHCEFSDIEFGSLLLDWSDFVTECEYVFDGDLWEYRQGLKIRDMIETVIELLPVPLAEKIRAIVAEPDAILRKNLVDGSRRLDTPESTPVNQERFWYQGVVRNQGSELRRDLIRNGWFKGR